MSKCPICRSGGDCLDWCGSSEDEMRETIDSLTAENESAKLMCAQLTTELEKLKRIVEVLEKANDFYADVENWQVRSDGRNCIKGDKELIDGFFIAGKTARQAKEEVERIRGEGK